MSILKFLISLIFLVEEIASAEQLKPRKVSDFVESRLTFFLNAADTYWPFSDVPAREPAETSQMFDVSASPLIYRCFEPPTALPYDLPPSYSSWMPRYMRDSISWSRHFLGMLKGIRLVEENSYLYLEELKRCPGIVLDLSLNSLLALETDGDTSLILSPRTQSKLLTESDSLSSNGFQAAAAEYQFVLNQAEDLIQKGEEAEMLIQDKADEEGESEVEEILSKESENANDSLKRRAIRGRLVQQFVSKWRTEDIASTYDVLLHKKPLLPNVESIILANEDEEISELLDVPLTVGEKELLRHDMDSVRSSSSSSSTLHCLGQKFFTYPLHEIFQSSLSVLKCAYSQWGTEILFHRYLQTLEANGGCRTEDPDEADWFYLPLYITCAVLPLSAQMHAKNFTDTEDVEGDKFGSKTNLRKNLLHKLMDIAPVALQEEISEGAERGSKMKEFRRLAKAIWPEKVAGKNFLTCQFYEFEGMCMKN